MIEQQKNEVWLTPNKWSYEERRLHIFNGTRFFEKNYSKWATIEVDKFEDIDIISETTDNDYLVQFFNDTHYIDAEDTYYEYWWGNKSLKKKFDEETDGYGRIEDYIDDDVPYMVRNTAVISKKDYKKLKEVKDER